MLIFHKHISYRLMNLLKTREYNIFLKGDSLYMHIPDTGQICSLSHLYLFCTHLFVCTFMPCVAVLYTYLEETCKKKCLFSPCKHILNWPLQHHYSPPLSAEVKKE